MEESYYRLVYIGNHTTINSDIVNDSVILKVYSGQHIYLRKAILERFNLNENYLVRFQLPDMGNMTLTRKVIKITRSKNNKTDYMLTLPKKLIQKYSLKLPMELELKIIGKNKIGTFPISKNRIGFLDIVSLLDNGFTCFENKKCKVSIYSSNSMSHTEAKLPRFFKIDEFFLWNLGLYLAEGTKTIKHRISLSNNEPHIIKRFLKYLNERWEIERNNITIRIRVKKGANIFCIRKFWSDFLEIEEDNIQVYIVMNRPPLSKWGNAEVSVYNTILGSLHQKIIENIECFLDSKKNILAFIKGVEDGDGHVIKHKGCIEIGITTEKKFKKIITSSLSRLYGKPRVENHHTSDKVVKILYSGLGMALKFFFDGHFENHPKRQKKLIELIREFMGKDLKYLKVLKNGSTTIRNLEKEAGVSYVAANIMMKKYNKNGYVTSYKMPIKKEKRFYNSRVFKLSGKGNILVSRIIDSKEKYVKGNTLNGKEEQEEPHCM
ncbi:MAG: hypothetical protein ISS93_03475 [Candidatus Aenigmarchaeota archaeon]|nr:hypothetical protein [Candidatus Aenigmarchaeota archaeon]